MYKLDILIAAYEYPLGIKRILDSLGTVPSNVRIFVNDNSVTNSTRECIQNHPLANRVIYQHNSPGLEAVNNWNNLLKKVQAEYFILWHNDDWPVEINFLSILLDELEAGYDVLVLNQYVSKIYEGRLYPHMPNLLKKIIVDNLPTFLFRRNVLGAPTVLVVKQNFITNFDNRLKFIVDVDWYVRIFENRSLKIRICDNLSIMSMPHQNSITKSLDGTIKQLLESESSLLLSQGRSSLFLHLNSPIYTHERMFSFFEKLVWILFRIVLLPWKTLNQLRKKSHLAF